MKLLGLNGLEIKFIWYCMGGIGLEVFIEIDNI